ncbi:MAG: hypothetical protein KC501_05285 [Myxococcales bacterium]|nr:hypothetical protein [Myxococcales bacterium]
MKTMGACALGTLLVGACAPRVELEPAPEAQVLESAAYLVAPKCGLAPVTSLPQLLPDDRIMGAMELDVAHLRRGKLFGDLEKVMATEAADALAAMKECGVPLSAVDGVIMGFSDHDDVVMGARATDLGTPKTLDCLSKKIEAATGTAPWKRVTTGCTTTLELTDGEGRGFAVGRDMVVFASPTMEAAVERRVQGKDKSALEGRLGWVRREVDTSGTAWMASNLPAGVGSSLGTSMSGMTRVAMGVDATKGLGLKMGAGFASPSEAKKAAAELETQLVQIKAMLPLLGLPMSVGDSITIAAKGDVVSMSMFLTPDDLDALRKTIEDAMGASSSPPPPPSKRPGI